MHTDFVQIHWHTLEFQLLRRDPEDAEPFNGDYAFRSEAHSMEDCPFRDSDRIVVNT